MKNMKNRRIMAKLLTAAIMAGVMAFGSVASFAASNSWKGVAKHYKDKYEAVADYYVDKYEAVADYYEEKYEAVADCYEEKYEAVADYYEEKYESAVDYLKNWAINLLCSLWRK